MTTGRLAVLSNVNMNMVIRMLQKQAQVYEAEGYGNELGTLLNPQSSYHAYHAEITFLIMDLAELLEHDLDPVTAERKIGDWFRTLEGCLPREGVFYVSDVYLWAVELSVLADTGRKSQLEGIWERELRNLQQKHANVRSFPYRALTEHFGEEKAFSPKMWYMGKVLWGMEMQSALAEQILYRREGSGGAGCPGAAVPERTAAPSAAPEKAAAAPGKTVEPEKAAAASGPDGREEP